MSNSSQSRIPNLVECVLNHVEIRAKESESKQRKFGWKKINIGI